MTWIVRLWRQLFSKRRLVHVGYTSPTPTTVVEVYDVKTRAVVSRTPLVMTAGASNAFDVPKGCWFRVVTSTGPLTAPTITAGMIEP